MRGRLIAFFIAFVVLLTLALSAAIYANNAKIGVCLSFVLDYQSIEGASLGSSFFDKVLNAAMESGVKVAFFFNCNSMIYEKDYAVALMKAHAANMPIGVYALSNKDVERELVYQKFITKSVSRLVMTENRALELGGEFCLCYPDKMIIDSSEITLEKLAEYSGKNVAILIGGDTSDATARIINGIDDESIYIMTQTETGVITYRRENEK